MSAFHSIPFRAAGARKRRDATQRVKSRAEATSYFCVSFSGRVLLKRGVAADVELLEFSSREQRGASRRKSSSLSLSLSRRFRSGLRFSGGRSASGEARRGAAQRVGRCDLTLTLRYNCVYSTTTVKLELKL